MASSFVENDGSPTLETSPLPLALTISHIFDHPAREASLASPARGRVVPSSCPEGTPTDPDVQISRIRLLGTWARYVGRVCAGLGSGKRFTIRYIVAQERPR